MTESLMDKWQKALSELDPIDPRVPGCDAPAGQASIYFGYDGTLICRCMVCDRCGRHTGNSHQGHYWAFCQDTGHTREFHFCCPNDCELKEK